MLPRIHQDLPLDEKLVGVVTSLPVLLFAVAAIPGSVLIAHLGVRRAVIGGLAMVGVASSVRGYGPSLAALIGATFFMGLGVALIQPGFPSLVRHWFPGRVGFATALYTNGLLIGESTAAAVTLPLVLPLAGGSWELTMAIWSLPVWLVVALLLASPRESAGGQDDSPRGWWPDWRNRNTWVLGLILGFASMAYWGSNGFIPDYFKATHRSDFIAPALSVLNLSQFPSSVLVAGWSKQLLTSRAGFIVAGAVLLAGFLGLVLLPGPWPILAAGVVGLASALVFVMGLALPPLLAAPSQVHRLAAAMFTITYSFSFAGPVIGGALWDASHIPATAFLPPTLGAVAMSVLALAMRMPRSTEELPPGQSSLA